MPRRLILGPDTLEVEAMGLLFEVGATKVAGAGTELYVELELVVKGVLELVPEIVLAFVIKVVLELVLKVVEVAVSVHVSLVGEIAALVSLGDRIEDIPARVGSTVVVIVISVSDMLGKSISAIHINLRYKGKRLLPCRSPRCQRLRKVSGPTCSCGVCDRYVGDHRE